MIHTTTRLRLVNDLSGRRRTVRLPMAVADAVRRLRQIIDPPNDDFDPMECSTSCYATAHGRAITLTIYGCDKEAAHAETRRIIAELRRAGP